jgi:dTDP-4-dehydrorhamnose reductase
MNNVWVIGSTGMLGTAVVKELDASSFPYLELNRDFAKSLNLDFGLSTKSDNVILTTAMERHGKPNYIVNALGVVKPRIDEKNPSSIKNAIDINILFSRNLSNFCLEHSIHLVQIATDCVFSGFKGRYLESDLHDPLDVYGKTKSLGECVNPSISLIRCSIIGSEIRNKYSLVEWVNSQQKNATVRGFTNHDWNGVTTKVFGRIVVGIIHQNIQPFGMVHLVPRDQVNKFELVNLIKGELGREDLRVNEFKSELLVNRTLSTVLSDLNELIWKSAGFAEPPRISEMIKLGL